MGKMRLMLAAALLAGCVTTARASRVAGPSGYTIEVPKGWKSRTMPGGTPELAILGPARNGFAPNVNVLVTQVPAGMTMDRLRQGSLQMLKAMFPGFRLLSSGRTRLGGKDAIFLEYNANMLNPPRPMWLRQVMVLQGTKQIVFTCTTLKPARAAAAPAFAAAMKSVKWTR